MKEIYVNGDLEHRIPGNLNISFAHVEGELLMMGIKNLAVSFGSACTSASLEPSYVLRALGVEGKWRTPRGGSGSAASLLSTRLIPPSTTWCVTSTASTR